MSILVLSVSHKTAPMEVLSRFTLEPTGVTKLAQSLTDSAYIDEAAVLSTCNRTEIYVAPTKFHGGLGTVVNELSSAVGVPVEAVQESCAVFYDEAAVSHCFSMAAGLESLVVGEHQILGQTKQALTASQQAGTVGTALNSLFQQSLRVAKRVHTETEVGSAGRSLITAAVDRLEMLGVPVAGTEAVVVGAGSMASLAAHTVAALGARVSVVNRTLPKAERVAAAVGGRARPITELDDAIRTADVLVTCTGARSLTLGPQRIAHTSLRGIIDLALPNDVAEEVGDLPGVTLVNLNGLVHGGFDAASAQQVTAARELVAGEVSDFLGSRRAAAVTPTVVALRTMAAEVMELELNRLDTRIPELDPAVRTEVAQTVRRVVEKLLHQPTVRVKELSADPNNPDYAAALRELFALDSQTVTAVSEVDR
ncbi:glutamyl-tRNA reductase [Granulicoccus phenolivorans]|uniref:glutamyl-tRNA reductase n=1 Tax=Granulicoccus phenolivorans TaxID=266854 RepID=UPI00041F563B|nr:glutamyl-tRNA reductase [Granulicoccus phenolivorans]